MLVRIYLSALTRVQWAGLAEVPDDFTQEDLRTLTDLFYEQIEGGDFEDDIAAWDKGTCYAEPVTDEIKPDYEVDEHFNIRELPSAATSAEQAAEPIVAIPLDELATILYRESSVIAAEDVPLLLRVIHDELEAKKS
jgi:hypothetical protein